MRKIIAITIALTALCLPAPAAAEVPPFNVSNSVIDASFNLAYQVDSPSKAANATLSDCQRRDAGGWRCPVLLRWRTPGTPPPGYDNRCTAYALAWPNKWRFGQNAGDCPWYYLQIRRDRNAAVRGTR